MDVRSPTEFGICHLPTSTSVYSPPFSLSCCVITSHVDIPLPELVSDPTAYLGDDPETYTFVVCRLGNDSQIAAGALRSVGQGQIVKDLIGGLRSWSRDVDPNFPVY